MQSSSLETASENIRQQKEEWEKALVARAKALDTLREDLVLREKVVAEREHFSEKNEEDQTKSLEEEWHSIAKQRLELKELKDVLQRRGKKLEEAQASIQQEKESIRMMREDALTNLTKKSKVFCIKKEKYLGEKKVIANKAMEIDELNTTLRNTQRENHALLEGKEKVLEDERQKMLLERNEETLKTTKRLAEVEELRNDLHMMKIEKEEVLRQLQETKSKVDGERALILAEKEQLRETISLSESKIAAKEYNLRAMEDDAKIFMQDLREQHKTLKAKKKKSIKFMSRLKSL